MNNELKALLLNICEEPFDDGLRYILADWFEDQGQDEAAHSIRAQLKEPDLEGIRIPDELISSLEIKDPYRFTWGRGLPYETYGSFKSILGLPDKLNVIVPLTKITALYPTPDFNPDTKLYRWQSGWWESEGSGGMCHAWRVPADICVNLQTPCSMKSMDNINVYHHYWYKSVELAHKDLSQACVNHFRKKVKLPKIEWGPLDD